MTTRAPLALAPLLLLAALGAGDEPAPGPLLTEARGRTVPLEALRHRGWHVVVLALPERLEATLAGVASTSAALAEVDARLLVAARSTREALARRADGLPVPLVADPQGALAAAWGVGEGVVVLDPALQVRATLPPGADALAVVTRLQAETPAVDLRPAFAAFGLPVRRQGGRGTCSVFTATGALELALAVRRGEGRSLSVEFLNWAANQATGNPDGDGQFFHSCLDGFARHGLCAEERMPYLPRFDRENAPSAAAREEAAAARDEGLRVHWIKPIGTPKGATPDEVRETCRVLARGFPVAAGSYHSVLLVGYETGPEHPGGGVFITHDSGAGGVRSMSFAEAGGRLNDIFWVQAAPRAWWE